ncbi:PhzF family phenazine biosynthesis protein [Gilvimarinus agarilyticus]|uniref:PhzF family phenazine biosynthesis protein n=1 Tax=Gilvimarinus sp. 2_MG-2023 TaxID=3062666 RepID=UPI001C087672|nr:PhzF family phenazine biosynthesis protein [Gilvimarinus sp. 2_MG-2023]MBU2887327.1 PhzF family phenazine biosynthesis protein [Gilvimarinus agarilyticus]MDO6571986.1 PhzF family phenazine biosynthesis protein [Gilvimarinus sp. 2_MG-2023]
MPTKQQEYRAFCTSNGSGGNCHNVVFTTEDTPPHLDPNGKWVVATQARHNKNNYTDANADTNIVVSHFDRNHKVKRCGSGSIALARALQQKLGHNFACNIETDSGPLMIGCDTTGPYYIDQPLSISPAKHPKFWSWVVPAPIIDSRYCGGPQEYCLIQLTHNTNLRTIQPFARRLTALSGRALILVVGNTQHPKMRYFAPQYGVGEDTATGSAAVQVANFYWQKYRFKQLYIEQQSPQGGLIHTQRLNSHRIKVRGNCIRDVH